MADVFFELSDLEISKEEVRESTSIEELSAWLDEQNEVSQEIAIMLGAMKQAPNADTINLARKLGFVNMSKAWIQKRLTQLGVDDERVTDRHWGTNHGSGLKKHCEELGRVIQEKNARIKEQNVELTALRLKVSRYEKANTQEKAA